MSDTVKNIFKVVNKNTKPAILMDGYIGRYDKVNTRDFQKAIADMEAKGVKKCQLLINSGGGSTIEGLTIGDFITNSSIEFHGIVIGMAASMAGGILMFCQKRSAYKNARIMTHKVKGGDWGEAEKLRSMADLIDQEEQKIIAQFVETTGKDEKEVLGWFKSGVDKWFTSKDALENNIIQQIIEPPKKTKNIIPENVTDEAEIVNAYQLVVSSYLPNETNLEINMNKASILAVLATAGLANNLTDNSSDGDFKSVLEGIVAKAAKADDYKNQLDNFLTDNGTELVNQAIKAGKIPANEKQDWIDDYKSNPKMTTRAIARMAGMPNPNNGVQTPTPSNGDEDEPKHELLKGREEWTFDKWQDEAPQDLEKIHDEAPEVFDAITEKQ